MVPYFREQQYDDDDSHSQCRQTAAAGEKSKLADCLCDKIKVHGLLQNHTPHAAAATLWPTMKGDNYDLIHLLTLYIYISFLGKVQQEIPKRKTIYCINYVHLCNNKHFIL